MNLIPVLLPVLAGLPADALDAYVARRDPTTRWAVVGNASQPVRIDLTSQTWQGIEWKHAVTIRHPKRLGNRGHAVLIVTGGKPNQADEADAQAIADVASMPVATLYHIPNQPIWGLNEDALIAATLQKWFATKDDGLPLLFPMAKSAIEAINALEKSTAKTANPLKKFVVTGGSKRGWTAWLAGGTGDRRIAGLAPVVFDNLNLVPQMKHQKELWGDYSPMVRDYVNAGLMQAMETPDGKRLAAMIDPLTYAGKVRCPVFMIHGANDPYWTADALSLYRSRLKMPNSVLYQPNEGHTFRDKEMYRGSLGAFAASCAGEFRWPSVSLRFQWEGSVLAGVGHCSHAAAGGSADPRLQSMRVYGASSANANFAASRWTVVPTSPLGSTGPSFRIRANRAVQQPTGLLGLFEFRKGRHRFWLSSPIRIVGSKG